jgi:DNA primase
MWIDELNNMTIWDFYSKCGYKRTRGNGLSPCHACGAEKRGGADTRGPIGVRGDGDGYRCFRCSVGGDKIDLFTWGLYKKRCKELSSEEMKVAEQDAIDLGLCSRLTMKKSKAKKVIQLQNPQYTEPVKSGGKTFQWRDSLVDEAHDNLWTPEGLDKPKGEPVLQYLISRGFEWESIVEFKLGAFYAHNQYYLVIPVLDKDKKPINAKFRSISGNKKIFRSPNRPTALFGGHTLSDKKEPVVITEGELDAIALWQYGFKENVVSGTAGASCWKEEWLDMLEDFKSFIICYDNDKVGHDGAKTVAERLGLYRCSRAILPFKDAADCLQNKVEKSLISKAFVDSTNLMDVSIVGVEKFSEEIEELVQNPAALMGRPTGSSKLDRAIGGLRDGLVIATGPTGAGKTTVTTWLAWQQAYMGHGVLLTSFEQRPIGTVQKLLRQQMGGDFTAFSPEQRKQAMRDLGNLPIHIVDHYGNISFEELLDVIKFSIRRKDVKTVVVDHLGFIVDSAAKDERREIEKVIRTLATVAVNDQVTVILICHPNRVWVGQQRRVQINDLKGASAIEQDAHVGIVIERVKDENAKHPQTKIHVDKCRSEFGLMGSSISLAFDPNACVYADDWGDTPMGRRTGGSGSPVFPQG